MDDQLRDFRADALEGLGQKLDTELVRLERQPDDRRDLASIFRHIHTIKGTRGFRGLARFEKVAHAAENVPEKHRDCTMAVTQASITLILPVLDSMRGIVEGIRRTGNEPDGDDGQFIDELNAGAEGRPFADATGSAAGAPLLDHCSPCPASAPAVSPPAAAPPSSSMGPTEALAPPEPAAQTIRVDVDVANCVRPARRA